MSVTELSEAVEVIRAVQTGSSVPPVREALDTIWVAFNFLDRTGVATQEDFDDIIGLLDRFGDRLLAQQLLPDIEQYFIQRFTSILDFLTRSIPHIDFPASIYSLWGKINVASFGRIPHNATLLLEIASPGALSSLVPKDEALAALDRFRESGYLDAVK